MNPAGHHHPVNKFGRADLFIASRRIENVSVAGRAFPPGARFESSSIFCGSCPVVRRLREQPGQDIVVIAASGELDPARSSRLLVIRFSSRLLASWRGGAGLGDWRPELVSSLSRSYLRSPVRRLVSLCFERLRPSRKDRGPTGQNDRHFRSRSSVNGSPHAVG